MPRNKHYHRRSIRLKGYDYTQPGAYFVTICTHSREILFGQVMDGEMVLNEYGQIVQACWREIPAHFPHVALEAFVVMPNHIHGIILIVDDIAEMTTPVGATHASPLQNTPRGPVRGSLGAIVGGFKSAATRRINTLRNTPSAPVWQRNYYEHIVRNDRALNAIRRYIAANPVRWDVDRYNPHATGRDPWAAEIDHLLRITPFPKETP